MATKANIPGWGADLAPENRPGVPRENFAPGPVSPHWTTPERQTASADIFLTVERDEMTPVFGTSCPPRGLSGALRRQAYRLGEGRLSRWLTLLAADRIDVVEGLVEDLRQGRLPHPIREMGLRTELTDRHARRSRYHRQRLATAAAGVGALAIFAIGTLKRRARAPGSV
jgi:hypothetical protein